MPVTRQDLLNQLTQTILPTLSVQDAINSANMFLGRSQSPAEVAQLRDALQAYQDGLGAPDSTLATALVAYGAEVALKHLEANRSTNAATPAQVETWITEANGFIDQMPASKAKARYLSQLFSHIS